MVDEHVAPPKIRVQFLHEADRKQALKQLQTAALGIQMFYSDSNRLDIIREGVSKARGLRIIGQQLGITPDEMVAVGTYENDIEMVNQSGLGVAMGNAVEAVKESADWITRSHDENGVSYMIHEVFRKQLRVQI